MSTENPVGKDIPVQLGENFKPFPMTPELRSYIDADPYSVKDLRDPRFQIEGIGSCRVALFPGNNSLNVSTSGGLRVL